MVGHAKKCVERYCELANKTTQQIHKVPTPCIDDHHFKEEDMKSVGELSQVCSQIVLECWKLARIGRHDILWSVNKLARSITKWTKACYKRLTRLISYIHHTCEYQGMSWRIVLFGLRGLQVEEIDGTCGSWRINIISQSWKIWCALNVNVNRTESLLENTKTCLFNVFLLEQKKNYRDGINFTQKLSRGLTTKKDMLKSALKDFVSWQTWHSLVSKQNCSNRLELVTDAWLVW